MIRASPEAATCITCHDDGIYQDDEGDWQMCDCIEGQSINKAMTKPARPELRSRRQ